jgi:hypothetical protein
MAPKHFNMIGVLDATVKTPSLRQVLLLAVVITEKTQSRNKSIKNNKELSLGLTDCKINV